jgi:predicted dehydrogenase
LDAASAGSGVTGDLLAHSIDLALWLAGDITSLTAMTDTFIKERTLQDQPEASQPVTIDDTCGVLARFKNGATGVFDSTRYARGRKNYNVFEINGQHGSLLFNYEDSHRLSFFDHTDDDGLQGWRSILATDSEHPYMDHWWVPGCTIGYEHTFIHTLKDFCEGLWRSEKKCPDFRDALATQQICDSIISSAADRQWKTIPL